MNYSEEVLWGIGLFFLLQLANVILSTMRSILTIKASKHVAAIMNAVSYTFYSAIVKLMTSQDMIVIIAVTFISNMIGVYIARFILDKMEKEKLWRISATVKTKDLESFLERLKGKNIKFVCGECMFERNTVDMFSYTQGESELIKEFLKEFELKYHVMEISKKL